MLQSETITGALPLRNTWYPLCRRVGAPQGGSESVRKISPPPGFDPQTFRSVASRYTGCPVPAHNLIIIIIIIIYVKCNLLTYVGWCEQGNNLRVAWKGENILTIRANTSFLKKVFATRSGFDMNHQTHIRAGEVLEAGTRVASTYIIGWWLKRLGGRRVAT